MRQWLRKIRLTFPGGFVINPSLASEPHELRVHVTMSKGISAKANEFQIEIWNLNPDHRFALGRELDTVQIEAGYVPPEEAATGGNVGIIGVGNIRDYQHDRDGPDIITTISCGDGDLAFRNATISETIPKGTPLPDVVDKLYAQMEKEGIRKGEFKYPEKTRTLSRPYSMCGSCTRELNNLGRSNGFYWSIQNGVMELIPSDGYLEGMVLVSPATGMVGTPTITDNGMKVKALMNPEARPNRLVKVESEVLEMNAQSDTYRISQLDYDLDNMQGDFTMSIQGESLQNGKVDEGVKATTDKDKMIEELEARLKASQDRNKELEGMVQR